MILVIGGAGKDSVFSKAAPPRAELAAALEVCSGAELPRADFEAVPGGCPGSVPPRAEPGTALKG